MTDVAVRTAGPEDAPALLPLFAAVCGRYMESCTVQAAAEGIARAAKVNAVLMASDADEVVGFASVRLIPQMETHRAHAELWDIYLDLA